MQRLFPDGAMAVEMCGYPLSLDGQVGERRLPLGTGRGSRIVQMAPSRRRAAMRSVS